MLCVSAGQASREGSKGEGKKEVWWRSDGQEGLWRVLYIVKDGDDTSASDSALTSRVIVRAR